MKGSKAIKEIKSNTEINIDDFDLPYEELALIGRGLNLLIEDLEKKHYSVILEHFEVLSSDVSKNSVSKNSKDFDWKQYNKIIDIRNKILDNINARVKQLEDLKSKMYQVGVALNTNPSRNKKS